MRLAMTTTVYTVCLDAIPSALMKHNTRKQRVTDPLCVFDQSEASTANHV